MNTPLPEDLRWSLERCDGYMDLSMWDAASALLKGVPEEFVHHPQVQTLMLRGAMHKKNWALAVAIASDLHRAEPHAVHHWISLAYALRRDQGIPAARKVLTKAREEFPDDPIVAFNLACYDCVEGHQEAAVTRLTAVLEKFPEVIRLIESDDDLVSIREFFDEENL